MPAPRKVNRVRKTTTARWNPKPAKNSRRSSKRFPTRMRKPARRQKISTTVAAESYAFLNRLIKERKAGNLAEAIDLVLDEARRLDNRDRLERATAAYYEEMSPEERAEDAALEAALTQSVAQVNLDE